jgi:isocitrate/isopropylmalate dehydrogenase
MLKVFTDGKVRTRDIGGTAHTDEFARAVVEAME